MLRFLNPQQRPVEEGGGCLERTVKTFVSSRCVMCGLLNKQILTGAVASLVRSTRRACSAQLLGFGDGKGTFDNAG